MSANAAAASLDTSSAAGPGGLAVIENYAWTLTHTGARVTDLTEHTTRAIAIPGARAVAGAGGIAWLRAGGALLRFSAAGAYLGTTSVDAADAGCALTACRIGAGAVVAQGPRPVWLDADGCRELGAATESVIPVVGGIVTRIGRRFALRGERGSVPLAIPSDLMANASLCGGAVLRRGTAVGLELRSRGGHHVLAVDLATQEVTVRLRLTGARAVAWVEERAQVAVVRDSELVVLDLEHGRCLMTRRLDEPVAAVAADERGRWLVLADGERLTVLDYSDLVGAPPPLRGAPVANTARDARRACDAAPEVPEVSDGRDAPTAPPGSDPPALADACDASPAA